MKIVHILVGKANPDTMNGVGGRQRRMSIVGSTNLSRTWLSWGAVVHTTPLGTPVGDFLDKPINHGGLALSRYTASLSLAAVMLLLIFLLPRRAGQHPA